MSDIIKTFFSESTKAASNVAKSIVPVNVVFHGIVPFFVFIMLSLYVTAYVLKIGITGTSSYRSCKRWSDSNKNNKTVSLNGQSSTRTRNECLEYEDKTYDKKWNILAYVLVVPLVAVILAFMWYKLMFYVYNPYIAAASFAWDSF